MKNRSPLKLGAVLCTMTMLLCGACLPGTALSTTSDEALSRMEERRRGIAERMERSTVFIMAVADDGLGMSTKGAQIGTKTGGSVGVSGYVGTQSGECPKREKHPDKKAQPRTA